MSTHMQGSRQQKATAATVTPVRLADGGVALESNFRQGVKHEVLRSLCQLVNTTKLALEVGLPHSVPSVLVLSSAGQGVDVASSVASCRIVVLRSGGGLLLLY